MHADTYILKTGEIGAQRLYMQHEVYGPSSEEFLCRAGKTRVQRLVRRGLRLGGRVDQQRCSGLVFRAAARYGLPCLDRLTEF